MDSASMRRFSFKVGFDYSGPEQIIALYNALLAPTADAPLSRALKKELMGIKNLTPGDFHAVQARLALEKSGKPSPNELIAELKDELQAKLDKAGRSIGF